MQVAEIRWATGHPVNESQSYRMPVNRGVTFIRAETENTASSRFNRLQHNLTHAFGAPNAWETDNTPDVWQFIFEQDDRRYLYSTDQETPAWEPYFRQSVVGKESELLGSQIDLERLADHNLTSKAKRIYLETLMRRYVESYTHLAGANERSGHLALLREELAECEQEIEARKLHTVRDRDLVLAIEEDERRLADLKADDLRLAQDQKKGQLLGSKAEYESLLKLRQQLKETEEREGVYGSRITNPGHNITVHELTELARLRNEVKGIEEEIKGSNDSVEEKRKQLMVIERDRIILAREVMDLEQQKDTLYMALDAEQAIEPVEGEEAQADRDVSFPTSGHLIVLLSLFMMAAGLIVTFFFKIPGLIMIGVAFLIALMIPIRGLQKRLDAARLQQAISRQDTEREEIQDKLRHAQHLVSSSADKLGQYEEPIDRLKLEESQLGSRLEALNRNLGYARADLLATVSRYAGPSEVEEVDDIITMLSRQRDSSAEYNETVSDLLRRIAELKHGRSEDEMSREYDRVCRQLYGDFNDPALASNSLYTKELFYDPEHLRQISERRMELAEQIDELAAGIQDHKSILKASREATVAIGSLERKCDTLNESLQEARNDLLRLDSSIVWLEELLASWTEIDVMVCMGRTTRYLNRLMGRRDAKTLRMTPLLIPNTAMRPPKLLDKESVSGQLSGTADYSIFSTAPSEFRYLAFRLALSDLQDREQSQAGPLIWIDPVIPDELSFQDELVSALEEWTLETGRQIIYFTRASRLIALANDRKMKVYNIE